MRDLHDEHIEELRAAQEAHNAALDTAMRTYADAIHASRDKLARRMAERIALWNGDVTLPPAPQLNVPIPLTATESRVADTLAVELVAVSRGRVGVEEHAEAQDNLEADLTRMANGG